MSSTEILKFLKEERGNAYCFWDGNLPDRMPNVPTVSLFRDKFVRFRNDYAALLGFAAHVLNKPAEEVCAFDLVAHLLHQAMKEEGGDA